KKRMLRNNDQLVKRCPKAAGTGRLRACLTGGYGGSGKAVGRGRRLVAAFHFIDDAGRLPVKSYDTMLRADDDRAGHRIYLELAGNAAVPALQAADLGPYDIIFCKR